MWKLMCLQQELDIFYGLEALTNFSLKIRDTQFHQ